MLTTISAGTASTLAYLVRTMLTAAAVLHPAAPDAEQSLELAGRPAWRVESSANAHTASAQEQAALGRDAAGRTVVVWQSKRQEPDASYGIFARRFDASGAPLGSELHVNQLTAGVQARPAVALAPSGAAWFAWESYGQDGHQGGVLVRRFDPELEASSGELLADTLRDGHQAEPAVAVAAPEDDGRALVVWTGPGAEQGTRVVRARLFAAGGTPLGAPLVLSEAAARDSLPALAADPLGGFQVAWARADLEGRPAAIMLRALDAEGTPRGGELAVAEGPCIEPAIDVDARGRVLVAWMNGARGDWAPELRALSGGALTPVRAIDPGMPGHASGLALAAQEDGTAFLAWSRFGGEQKTADLFVQAFDGELAPLGAPLAATESLTGHQRLGVGGPRRMAAGGGTLALCWDGAGPNADASGVDLTLFADAALSAGDLVARTAPADSVGPVELGPAGAEPHEPPFFTGPVDPALRAIESLGGPDYGFQAIPMTALTPPDPHISAGPGHVVCIVNGELAFYDKDGTETFSAPLDGASGFWAAIGAANGFIFDPETLYDPHTGRFMMMANERNGGSFFLLAVSDDSDPKGTWFKYRFNVTAASGNGFDIDSPNFAVDEDVVYLTADFFGPDRFLVYMVEKAPLLTGAPNPIQKSLLINGSQSYGVPVTYDATAPAQYMIEAFESFSNNSVRFHAITNPLGTPQRVTFDLAVPTYQQPENPPQLGTSIRPETFESRFWSAMYRNGSLWATHHVNSTQVRQRWYQFAMNGWPSSGQNPTLVQSGEISLGESVRSFFGSLWADDDGNAGMVFARSSPSEFISMARAFRRAGDPLGTMTPSVIMQTSDGPDTSGRWGDYSGTVSDPDASGAFWGYAEYRQGGIWRTWVGLMGPCETPIPYCTAKLTSIGTLPAVGWSGEPSFSIDDFEITMTGGLPGKMGLAFYGLAPAANPFFGGTKCAANPVVRTPLFTLDPSGGVSLPIPLVLDDLGETRYYQFWFRDPLHPDGTGIGLSNALELTVCP